MGRRCFFWFEYPFAGKGSADLFLLLVMDDAAVDSCPKSPAAAAATASATAP